MNKMKKLKIIMLSLFFFMGLSFFSYSQNSEKLYLFDTNSSIKHSFEINDISKIILTDEDVQVHTKENVASFGYQEFSKLTFKSDQSSIKIISTNDVNVFWESENNKAVIKSSTIISIVNLFDLNGVLLQRISPQSSDVDVSMAVYPAGIYILQIGNKDGFSVHKIIKH